MAQSKVKSKSRYDRRPVSQYVLVPSPHGFRRSPSKQNKSDIRRGILRPNFLCYHWVACMWSMQFNVEFGYQLSICSRTKENRGKPWSSWPVAGPSGYTSPYLFFFSFFFCLCGLVVRVPGYRSRGPGFNSRALQEKKGVALERGPLSLVSATEELLARNSSSSGLEGREYGRRDLSRWPRGTL
jgi:hypothetical protein